MSEIFAPGSIAGPTGPTGATGPTGPPANFAGAWASGTAYTAGQAVSYTPNGNSYVALTSTTGNEPDTSPAQWGLLASAVAGATKAAIPALAGATLPVFTGRNLFDLSTILAGMRVNAADGSLSADTSSNASALIYCPGATSMVSNLTLNVDYSGGGVCLYDANGSFLSSLGTGAFSALNGEIAGPDATLALPGTQTYVRICYFLPWLANTGYCGVDTAGMIYAAIAGTATLPSSYQPAGLDTSADVNAKILAAQSNLTPMLALFEKGTLSGPTGGNRNLFDYTKSIPNTLVNSDGSIGSTTNANLIDIFCPNATSFLCNFPINAGQYPGNPKIVTLDVNGNFLADITPSILAQTLLNGSTTTNVVYPLPGNQTYLRCSWVPSQLTGNPYPSNIESCVFYAGTSAFPPPSSFTYTNWSQPFGTNAPVNVKTATQLGASVKDNFSQEMEGVLNAFLATASSTNPIKLILDGMFTVSGLVISPNGYTCIEGLGAGTGISLPFGTPQDAIRIGAYTSSTGNSDGTYNITAPSRSAVNIVLRDFTVDAANQINASANQPVSGAAAHSTFPVILTNCSNVMVDNLNFSTNGANYCITISNGDHICVTNCNFTTTGTIHDGIHVDGPANDIGIDNCDFSTGDDAIALNAPEGYGGDISRVTITNCRYNNSESVLRIYTSIDPAAMPTNNVHKVRNVVVSNCTGTVTNICFVIGIEGSGLTSTSDADQIQDLSVTNCTFSAPFNLMRVRDNIGAFTFRGVNFIPTSTSPVFDILYGVGELMLDGVTILRNPDGNAAPGLVSIGAGSSIDRLSLLNFRVVDELGSSYTAVPWLVDAQGSVTSALRLEAVDMTHVTALVSSAGWTGIATVRGAGVLGTQIQVPDATMDNGYLYLSSTDSGAVSLKVGGTAKRVNLT